jgi:predicted nucleic acid-binding Zn ribbon protein
MNKANRTRNTTAKRSQVKKRGPEKIGTIVDSVLSEKGYSSICKEYDVVAKWNEIAGPRLANVTECSRLENSVLYVKVASAPWRQEISYLKRQLLDKITEVTGCKTIRDIVFC